MPEENNNEQHWSQGFENAAVTTENREAFNTSMSKYATQDDAIVGSYNAQKAMGKPFRVPESMDKLPDDASRDEFSSQARSALGINTPNSVDDLKDFNFKEGLADDAPVNEALVGKLKEWAVDAGVDTGSLQKMVSFYNGPLGQFAMEAKEASDTAAFETKATACNEALIADYGSTDKVQEQTELFKRAISAMATKNGLDVEATTEVVQAIVDGGITTNPKLAKIMLQAFAPMAAEGGTFSGDGTGNSQVNQQSPYAWKKERFPKSPSEWGNESDAWDGESQQLRNLAGIK